MRGKQPSAAAPTASAIEPDLPCNPSIMLLRANQRKYFGLGRVVADSHHRKMTTRIADTDEHG
jgi:hypothetical protein